jgi:ABC-type lipoprotein release transport system permease subunit
MFFTMAWRNIWRNPRRTAVILIAIVIGVWSMIALGALMRGMFVGMIDNGISTLTGDLQIHDQGYHRDPVIDHTMTDPGRVIDVLEARLPPGSRWTGRVRVNAVASNARHNSGVTLVGMDPATEAEVSFIGPEVMVDGQYLEPDDHQGILVGKAFMEKYETKIGYKVVLMSEAADDEIASRAFRIRGVFDAEMESTEKRFVFVTRPAARDMLKMDGLSEFSISLPQGETPAQVKRELLAALPEGYEVLTWKELLPTLRAYVRLFNGVMTLWYVVVFIAMSFGLVNTILMAVFERMREFGLLKAMGMKPIWIVREVVTEAFFLLIIGLAAGNALGLVTVWALSGGIDLSAFATGMETFSMTRMIYPAIWARDVITANGVVFGLGLLVSVYPAAKAARFTPVEALART